MFLLASCSYCKEDFKEGAARHMLGYYPMEQFCTYVCVEKYLANVRGLKHAIPVPPTHREKGLPSHPE
jgi:hypothetical protein